LGDCVIEFSEGEGVSAESRTDQGPLLELVQRLLIYPYPEGPTDVELLPGRLPDAQVAEIPIPRDARLVGSAIYRRGRDVSSVDIVTQIDRDTVAVTREYEAQLRSTGWEIFERIGGIGGFVPSDFAPRRFTRVRGGPALIVDAIERGGDATELRLGLDWGVRQQVPRSHGPEIMQHVPSLVAPPGVHVDGGGGGGGDSNWTSSGTARTDMPVGELEGYFAAQLSHAGWTRITGNRDDRAAWSAWNVPVHNRWIGLLMVVSFDSRERSLALYVQGPQQHHPRAYAPLTRAPWRRLHFR
jgi:hypothetical protein